MAISRQTQPKVQHMVTTFMGNKSRVLQLLSKSLTTLDVSQLMAHYHPQTWCSSHLEVVIISFFFGEVSDVPYGKPGVLNHWAGTVKGQPTHRGGYHLHIGDPRGLVLYHMASTHCSYCRFNDCFRLHKFQRHLEGYSM